MNVLFVIVARGGSKSIKNKNLRMIDGRSLIAYKAISARQARFCSRLIISTDSEAIQDEARRHGVEVPFTRPAELATDTASTMDVLVHAMTWIEQEGRQSYEALVLLEPSSPFATGADYDAAIEFMERKQAKVVVGMRAMEVNSTFVGPIAEDGRISTIIDKIANRRALARQQMDQEYTMNGCLYLIDWQFFRDKQTIYSDRERTYGYVMDRYRSIEIDEPIDLEWAEFLVERNYIDRALWNESN